MRVKWENLTNLALTLHHGSWIEDPDLLVEFIWGCQNLVVLSVVVDFGSDYSPRSPSSPTPNDEVLGTLPRLTTLLWDTRDCAADSTLFKRLLFPSLQELKWTDARISWSGQAPSQDFNSAKENSEEKQREFVEELTTKFGADVVEGLKMDIEWPTHSTPPDRHFAAHLPFYSLRGSNSSDVAQGVASSREPGFIFRLGHPDNLTSQLTESEADLCMQRRRQMVEQWLMRAGKTDLSISITDDARADIPSKENEPQHSVDIVEILVKYAGQLAVLDLGIAPRLAKPILGKKLTRLRDLRLCHREYYGSAQQNICTEHVIVSSPNIRSLRICISTPATNGMSVQWANLTNLALTLQHGSWIEDPDLLVEFIWGLQNLIVLSVVITAHRPIRSSTTLNNEVRRTLPRLKTLFWDNGGSGADDRLFERLVFPSLQELKWTVSDRFQSGGYGAPGFVKWDCPLTHLLERSGQNLKKLELGMLEEMPSLSNYSRLGFTPRIEMLHFELSSPVSASNIWRALSLPIPTPAHHRASAVRKPAPPPSAPISAQAPSVFQGGNVPVGSFPGGVQTWQSFGVQPFPKLAVLSCRCHTNDFAPDALQQFIRSRRDANILAKHGASKLQKISISLSNNHAPPYQLPYAISARENSEKKQREFMEELTTKFGAEVVGGLEMDIEWPNVYWTSSALLSPYSGLRFEDGQRYWTGGKSEVAFLKIWTLL
ncbi:hypothetical protein MD484_g8058, partial [Candolleomyces efflorescens]